MPTLVTPTVPTGSLAARPQPVLPAPGGLLLRPWQLGDAPAVVTAYQDPAIQHWHVRRADSVAEAEEWITDWRGGWTTETEAQWAVVDGDALLGRAALKHLQLADGTAEVAYWVAPQARGRGVAPRAVEAMADWAFGTAGFHRLELSHAVGNTASCRVATKTAFPLEGTRRSAWLQSDGRHDAHLHARLRSDLVPAAAAAR
ncbi:GNAT family N-acetyltransferase [Kitasatospora sp. NPDC051853]|uniref:GNAT family N-acetyltransferase n=1 Tax=Kitasatospora sp. NPDC051853 TaxID=3364058 RepID=UPI0037A3086D